MATFTPDTNNEMFQLAAKLVNQSHRNIFLTGKAGTGKTTFLKFIREDCPKQNVVVAPTGVAAINAGGVTIHSFFQLPLAPFIPENKGFSNNNEETINKHRLFARQRLTNEKKKLFQELELLIIDEISMVRCDTIDAIDAVLRHYRHRHHEQFGGVQVLFIGDMYQLPPVIPDEEWAVLQEYYHSPYFFDSRVMTEQQPLYIEFDRIYRQSEERFITLLNQIRNNELNAEGVLLLESRLQPAGYFNTQNGSIILTTHNYKADNINAGELQKLSSTLFSFRADIVGEFTEKSYPADELLHLKAGAQVMFIKNDAEKTKRYFNGKIGKITRINESQIFVQCPDEVNEIEVKKETWDNIRYTLNKSTHQLDQEVLGSFTQYPLRLAWAITIHKSQGLTFEKAIIDAEEAFTAGQVYVALSRCTSLNGLQLQSRIRKNSLICDERIVRFSQGKSPIVWLNNELEQGRNKYQQKILFYLFDLSLPLRNCKELMDHMVEHRSSFNKESFEWIEELLKIVLTLQQTAEKFHTQIASFFQEETIPEKNEKLGERIKAAAGYFIKQIDPVLGKILNTPATTDSRQHAKEVNENLKGIFQQLSLKEHLLSDLRGSFDIERFHQEKNKFIFPSFPVNIYAGARDNERSAIQYPELYHQLRKLRDNICARKDLPIYLVAGSRTLEEMSEFLPQTPEELQLISGFGNAKTKLYGQQFLDIIRQYCDTYKLTSRVAEKKPKRKRKRREDHSIPTNTKQETYKLYQEKKTIQEIAAIRKLTPQTIEGHLSYYVSTGNINVEELITKEKLLQIESALKDFSGGSITPIKEKLGNDISFGEIRFAIAWSSFKQRIHFNKENYHQ